MLRHAPAGALPLSEASTDGLSDRAHCWQAARRDRWGPAVLGGFGGGGSGLEELDHSSGRHLLEVWKGAGWGASQGSSIFRISE